MRDLRLAQGMSQNALAKVLGVSRQTINAIENERYDPSLPLAFAVAEIFDLSIEAIFTP
ncbi:helix-turn-helix transcriptional regulator [Asaia siamensis]|uniref:Transcriptional regulator n=1 Tax=Asaia siamensis TaxID=110479 RepID=A0ABQ1LNB6_9PROT|nr:helix-turn-helix transcriptional regulator [Asaia siamensis]GBR05772.1 putative transcriptional regulator [Asaia siamensis NRIC 0323]GGC27053.1 transcriptional regulator [Asaia siamensis]